MLRPDQRIGTPTENDPPPGVSVASRALLQSATREQRRGVYLVNRELHGGLFCYFDRTHLNMGEGWVVNPDARFEGRSSVPGLEGLPDGTRMRGNVPENVFYASQAALVERARAPRRLHYVDGPPSTEDAASDLVGYQPTSPAYSPTREWSEPEASAPPLPEKDEQPHAAFGSCVACMDSMAKVVFVGCGHMSLCLACAKKARVALGIDRCPTCRNESSPLFVFGA